MSELPGRPDIRQLRRQARELLDAARDGEPGALARLRAVSGRVTLSAAQLAIAREYGFSSWPALRAEVQRRSAAGPAYSAEDAEQWWDAFQLAENDQAGELRERADAGDEHARRQLASWLADRGYVNGGLNDPAGGLDEAIEVIRPLADAGDDIASMWLARWLADAGQLDELRERAASGSYHAVHELAEWLTYRKHWGELRQLMNDHWELLAGWRARQYDMNVMRLAAELGDNDARLRLDEWLSRRRARAAESESARRFLAELEEDPDWAPFLPLQAD
jgi:hypothetical protein